MNKAIVRITIFGTTLYYITIILLASIGIETYDTIHIYFIEYCFYLLVKSDTKHNCKWARFLALNIFLTDTFSYIDSIFNLIPNAIVFLSIVSASWIIVIVATIYQALKHLKQVRKVTDERKNR